MSRRGGRRRTKKKQKLKGGAVSAPPVPVAAPMPTEDPARLVRALMHLNRSK